MKRLEIKIYGQVHGVFFRIYAKERADELGVFGWVKNIEDGSVFIEVEGEEEYLENFLDWCHKGSPTSKVKRVEPNYLKNIKGYKNFEIRK